jgi:hypothetical protein
MKLVRSINQWTCFPAAVATILTSQYTLPLQYLFHELGHDGSEIVRPHLGDPQCRRGFHPQEMFEFARSIGFSVTQIDLLPAARPNELEEIAYFNTILGEDCETRFHRHLVSSTGWIECRTRRGNGHALAYENATIGDPSTGVQFTYRSRQDAESHGLFFFSLFRLDCMENSK